MEKDLLDKYSLTKEDFEVEKMPKLGSHGLRRSMRFKVWNSNVENSAPSSTKFSIK